MSRRSEEAQDELLDAAEEAAEQGHQLRAARLLSDCERLGPMNLEQRERWEAVDDWLLLVTLNERFYQLCWRCGIVPPIGSRGFPDQQAA